MTFVLGVIVGACAMWLRDWVRAKPASPLPQWPASDLRAMMERATAAAHDAHARWLRQRLLGHTACADEDGRTYHRLLDEVVMLQDALRIVESRETPDPRGPYR